VYSRDFLDIEPCFIIGQLGTSENYIEIVFGFNIEFIKLTAESAESAEGRAGENYHFIIT
jgi:hypothetical protein